MNHRAQHRRQQRAAAKGYAIPTESSARLRGRWTPDDHPDQTAEPLWSSESIGLRILSIVERSGVLPHIEKKLTGRRGRKKAVAFKTLLVAINISMYLQGRSYTRADVCAVIPGLAPKVALKLGVLDLDGNWHVPSYKSLSRTIKRLEKALHSGWLSKDCEECYDFNWYGISMFAASIPRWVRRLNEITVVIDSTSVEAWGCTKQFTKQKELEKDAFAYYRKAVLENPDLPDPELRIHALREEAKRKGLRVGRDGRIIRGRDEDARAGWATATNSRPGRYIVGYELTAAVLVQRVKWDGKNVRKFRPGAELPPFILAISVNPAGMNPGPVGVETIRKARAVFHKINRVVADRGFTLKRETFLRPLHKQKIDVVMDYTRQVVDKPEPASVGERGEPVYVHCGTILPGWISKHWRKPPKEVREDKDALAEWYSKRAQRYRYSFKGWLKDGGIKIKCPVCAGRTANKPATSASGTYSVPYTGTPGNNGACCQGMVNVSAVDADHFQKFPYGTPVWTAAYKPARAIVEGVFSDLKKKGGLSRGTCQALGIEANTMAAVASTVVHNIRVSQRHGAPETEDDSDGHDAQPDTPPVSDDTFEDDNSDTSREAPDRAPPS